MALEDCRRVGSFGLFEPGRQPGDAGASRSRLLTLAYQPSGGVLARMQGTLGQAHKTSVRTAPRLAAVVAIIAVLLICAYSAFAISRLVGGAAPPVVTVTRGTG